MDTCRFESYLRDMNRHVVIGYRCIFCATRGIDIYDYDCIDREPLVYSTDNKDIYHVEIGYGND